jgi:hypothetical protein
MVSFRPIPGHGRKSAAAMEAAGISCLAHSGEELADHLELLGKPGPARQAQLDAASDLFSGDAALAVAALGTSGAPRRPYLRPVVRVARAASTVGLAGAMAWCGLTTGVDAAAAAGLGVAHPPPGATQSAYVGVRLDATELVDAVIQAQLVGLRASAVIDVRTAEAERTALQSLVGRGISVESGGFGFGHGRLDRAGAPWSLAQRDTVSVKELAVLCGRHVGIFVPDRDLSAFDLVDASSKHVVMVVPNTTLPVAPSGPYPRLQLALPPLQGGRIYVVEGERLTRDQLVTVLSDLRSELDRQDLASAPLSALR